jgi:ribosome biogenesis GTPase
MILEDLGYNQTLENFRKEQKLDSLGVGRVISEHRERYVVKTEEEDFEAEIIGHLRFSARSRSDFPAVGDWVAYSEYDGGKALIYAVFPRMNVIERQAVGKFGQKQIIAANIDYALIVQAVDRDFNLNRTERYLTICDDSNVKPIIVLSKIDLISETFLKEILDAIHKRISNVPVIAISNRTRAGYKELISSIKKGKTYCLLGSSGVGKSTLINLMSGRAIMKTDSISLSTSKGRHVTSHRELIVLEHGGIIIDNPGMREVGVTEETNGLENTFNIIARLSEHCKFKNCTHVHESGCAVIEAVEDGRMDTDYYKNYLKIQKEKAHFESSVAEKRKKDRDFGKMVKNYKKQRKGK